MHACAAAGAAFLIAVLWFDLMFDVQTRKDASASLPSEVLSSISAYYRRVTIEAWPMNRMIAVVMLLTLLTINAEIVRGAGHWWVGWISLVCAASAIGVARMRTIPNAMRLGRATDSSDAQTDLARAIYKDHLYCLAAMTVLLALQLGSGSPKKLSPDDDKPRIATTCRIGETRAPMAPLGTPQEFRAGLSTKIDASLQVTLYPNLIPGSVTLLQVDSHANRMAVLGKMRADGRHRDVPVDYTRYSAQPTLGPSVAAGEIFLAAEASYSGSQECSRLDNNDHEIDAGRASPTTAQLQAEEAVENAAHTYYYRRLDRVGPVQAKQDLIKFLLSSYGPDGTVNRGLVVSAVLAPDCQSVWWTYKDGLDMGLAQGMPGVKGSRSPQK